MFGRSVPCLLAILLQFLAPSFMRGQTDRAVSPGKPGLAIRMPDIDTPLLPQPDLIPRAPVRLPGVIGLPAMAQAAGMIFSGTVSKIQRRPATRAQALETVAITFHVENAIRGATPGQDLTVSQWIGLWSGGQRYRIGERVLLFLYPPSKLGLTSLVAGPVGRFNLDAWGRILLSAHHLAAFRSDPFLGGKSRLRFSDFALAVRQAGEEERALETR
jgi:hypothetical protein